MNNLGLDYHDCPIVCGKRKPKIDIYRVDLCKECPRSKARRKLFRDTQTLIEQWMSEKDAETVKVAELYDLLMNVLTVRALPENKIGSKVSQYIEIYSSEEDRDEKWQRLINGT